MEHESVIHSNSSERILSGKDTVPRRFVVLTMQRSGSTWFIDLLNSADGIRTFGEVFLNVPLAQHQKSYNQHLLPSVRYYDFVKAAPKRKYGSAIKYLDYLFGSVREQQAVGIKLMWTQLWDHPEILLYLLTRRCSVIYLERENSLEQALSSEIAKSRGVCHSTGHVKTNRVQVESSAILQRVKRLERRKRIVRALLKWYPNPVITVKYESLRTNVNATVNMVTDFLGVSGNSSEIGSEFKKILGENTLDHIENASELRSLFERNGLGRFIP